MDLPARVRFFLETVAAVFGMLLAAITLVWPDWIERVFGVDPDGGSGLDEWLIVAASLSVALVSALLARREWRARSPLSAQES